MLILARRGLLAGLIAVFASNLTAQSCPTGSWPVIKYTGGNCAYPSSGNTSPCSLTSPVTFSLVDFYTGAPYALQSCETGVTWTFGDGTSTTGLSVQHTYSTAGSFSISASILSSASARWVYTSVIAANGAISMTAAKTSVNENEGSAVVHVHTTYSPASVSYDIYDDYGIYGNTNGRITPASGTVTFAAGEYDKDVSIPITDDSVYEGSATVAFRLSNPTNGVVLKDSYGYTTFGPTILTIQLLDNDPPPTLNFSSLKYTFSENAGTGNVTVVRTGDLTRSVGVSYTVSGATYTYGSLTFAANEASKTIPLTIPNDNVWTPDRSWSVEIYGATNGAVIGTAPNYSYYSYATVVITDDEPAPSISISDISVPEGNSGRSTANLTLTLSAPLTVYCTAFINYSGTATRTIDYDATVNSVYFNAGETTKTLPVTIIGDTQIEPNETVVATIASVSNGYYYYPNSPNVPVIAKANGTITIQNDDIGMPWLKLAAGASGRMTIYLGNPTTAQDTVAVTSSKPDVAKVSPSFLAQSGRSTLDFPVDAGSPGTSLITVKFPPSLGGNTLTANVDVYTPATLTMQPPSMSIPLNTTATLAITMSPAPATPVSVKVVASNASLVQAPATVNIDTTGAGVLSVKGLAVGTGALILTLPADNGGFDTTVSVNVTAPPSGLYVTQVSPSNGPTAGGTDTTITGLNFVSPCSVSFGGSTASGVTFVSANSLTATTPAHPAGTVDVSVTCGTDPDHFTFGNGFTYVAKAPHLSSVSPLSGASAGGTTVAVSGSDLRSACGVLFGGVVAKVIGDQTPDKLIVATPAHDPGAVDVTLQCNDSASTLSSAFAFVTGSEPAAVIGDVDPLAAAPGQTVNINGFRFRPSDTITFADTRAAVLSTTPTSHLVMVPNVAPGKVAITLTDSQSHTSTTGPVFAVLEPITPEITSVTPAHVAPGGEIVITGKGFRAPYTFALGDKQAGTVLDLSFSRAVVRLDPNSATGTFTLGVLNGNGVLAAIGPKIDVAAAVMASGVAPICATAAGGVDVTLTGSGFVPGTQVSFGSASATNIRVVDDHTIIATVPQGHIGWPAVTIANPNGDTATLTRAFFYYSPFDKDGGCASTRTRGVHH